jgi:hypothetical protein
LSYAGEALLQQALTQAGIASHDYETVQLAESDRAGHRQGRFNCVVALGDAASRACVADWAGQVADRRGYVWEGEGGCKVLTTLDPGHCVISSDPSGINGMLLAHDLEKAKNESKYAEIRRPERKVVIVYNRQMAEQVAVELLKAGFAACDIECHDSERTACIGFAPSASLAYVFTPPVFDVAHRLLLNPELRKLFQNGSFDLYHLLSRDNIKVAGYTDDTQVAWHCCWPEMAGAAVDSSGKRKGSKRTHKSLHFFASLYTTDAWWKDYDFATDTEMYVLNGKDCCITYNVHEHIQREIDELDVRQIYEHEIRLVWPCVIAQHRGLRVDDVRRREAITKLAEQRDVLRQQLASIAEPIIRTRQDVISKPHLFFGSRRCECCNGGAKKAAACWSCAGYDKQPGKKQQADLRPCAACNGAGRFETFEFNPDSPEQVKELLYNVFGLEVRMKKEKVSADEESLKAILGSLN